MAIQMIFCVETNKRADTDSIYISEVINHWYQKISNQVKLSKVYMNTKSRYNSKDVRREIAKKTKDFVIGETRVIYCIDTDQYEKNADHAKELNNISQYCKENNYDLIWFCHDVEEVFWGKRISDSQKVQEAGIFRTKKAIQKIQSDSLSCDITRARTSNILNILDKYLSRK